MIYNNVNEYDFRMSQKTIQFDKYMSVKFALTNHRYQNASNLYPNMPRNKLNVINAIIIAVGAITFNELMLNLIQLIFHGSKISRK